MVDLDFAELRSGLPAGRRVFDVSINGAVVLPNYDIAAAVGSLTADRRMFQVAVPAGWLHHGRPRGGALVAAAGDQRGQGDPPP